jgi:hypothetical protein
MIGARVEVVRKGASRWRRSRSDASYASANDPRVLIGLATDPEPPDIRVTWPDGRVETWSRVPVDRYTTLEQEKSR